MEFVEYLPVGLENVFCVVLALWADNTFLAKLLIFVLNFLHFLGHAPIKLFYIDFKQNVVYIILSEIIVPPIFINALKGFKRINEHKRAKFSIPLSAEHQNISDRQHRLHGI